MDMTRKQRPGWPGIGQALRGWRRWMWLGLLACGAAAAEDAASRIEHTLYARSWRLLPSEASVLARGDVALAVEGIACSDDGWICDLDPQPRPDSVASWWVNGVENGDAAVGRVVPDSRGGWRYQAPATPPSVNPVSVMAAIDTPWSGPKPLQPVSRIRVVPSGWSGHLTIRFEAQHNDLGTAVPAFDEGAGANDPPEIRVSGRSRGEIEELAFDATYAIAGVMVEAMSDDGEGLAILQLAAPSAALRYRLFERQGLSVGCRHRLGNTLRTVLSGASDSALYEAQSPSPITFNRHADGTSSVSALPPALLVLSGRSTHYACDGVVGSQAIQPFTEALGDTAGLVDRGPGDDVAALALPGMFRGSHGRDGIYRGEVALAGEMVLMGRRVAGRYTVAWDIRSASE